MKLRFLSIAFLFINISIVAQNNFKKGYIITDENKQIDCFIKDLDWNSNPTEFEYKINKTSEVEIGNLNNVKEFEILNSSKYVRFNGNFDVSSNTLSNLSNERNPIFEQKKLFVRVLVEGKATLYSYKNDNLYRYFYKIDDRKITQLVYKEFLINNTTTGKNNDYKQKVSRDLKCENISKKNILNLEYKESSLTNFFLKYNKCIDPNFENKISEKKKERINFYIKTGITSSKLTAKNPNSRDFDYGNKIGFTAGLELEYVLPFNNYKWSLLFETTYNNYSSNIDVNTLGSSNTFNSKANYNSIDLSIGARYYFLLEYSKSKLFTNLLLTYAKPTSGSFNNLGLGGASFNPSLGIGYLYDNKYNIELRYRFERGILPQNINYSVRYSGFSLIFAYNFL